MATEKWWRLRVICCGRDMGVSRHPTWREADETREGYATAPMDGHDRVGIIEAEDAS
jgi:hypothetical protein